MAEFKLDKKKLDDIQTKVQHAAKDLAIEAREKMTKEYVSILQQFYTEYEPEYYYRHKIDYSDSGIMDTGLGRTFEKYYKNSHDKIFSGGIWIDTHRHDGSGRDMYDDYRGTQEQVLNSFMLGYHGPVGFGDNFGINQNRINGTNYHGINKGLNKGYMDVYEHMFRYRHNLINELSKKLKVKL